MEPKDSEFQENINILRNRGYGLNRAVNALNRCGTVRSALTYLIMYGDATARYKLVDGNRVPWTHDDYVQYAIKNPYEGDL